VITRRGFIGTAAAALSTLLPSWRQFKQRRTIDLMPFCDDYVGSLRRYDMTKPFAQDGQAYATDGRICVRTTLAEVPALGDEVRLPPASQLPWWGHEGYWKPYPRLHLLANSSSPYELTCPICSGKGGLSGLVPCVACDGDGELCEPREFYGRGEDEFTCPQCKACRGTGWTCTVLCDYCEGTGSTRRPSIQKVGSLYVAGHYDRILRDLGDMEYRQFCDGGGEAVVMVRGDGFEGLMMPLDVTL